MTAPEREVRAFVERWSHDAYHSVPLPHGYRTPGRHTGEDEVQILDGRVQDKSVLDVGSYYGLFPVEAYRLGARSVVGIERDGERIEVARQIAQLWDGPIEYQECSLEEYAGPGADVVLCMNVLHHFPDPFSAMSKLARLASEVLIVEVAPAHEARMIQKVYTGSPSASSLARLRAIVRSIALRVSAGRVPIMAHSGNGWFFSREAFCTLFGSLFRDIRLQPSSRGRRFVAVCEPSRHRGG